MRRAIVLILAGLGLLLIPATSAQAVSPHEVPSDPIVCTLNPDNTVTCTGSVAGLGNRAVIVTVDVDFACATRGNENQPGGHLQAKSEPIEPRAGRITFSVTTGPATCPPGLNPVVGETATLTILDLAGNVLFTKTVLITRP